MHTHTNTHVHLDKTLSRDDDFHNLSNMRNLFNLIEKGLVIIGFVGE
jgi:hypothetical protein